MIPRVMNFFWHGGPMSWMRCMTLQSFRRWNPDWAIVLHQPSSACSQRAWKSREMDDQEYCGEDYLPRVRKLRVRHQMWHPPLPGLSPAHACDLFEWELLSTSGGFYSDMDILYVRPMDEVFQSVKESDAVFCRVNHNIAVGFLASSSANVLFSSILAEAGKSYHPGSYQCAGTEAVYRAAGVWPVDLARDPGVNDRTIERFRSSFPSLNIAVLPDVTVYPHDFLTAPMLYDRDEELPDETIGAHWFGGLAASQECNRKWTRENFRSDPCTFTRYARMSCE